MEVISENGKRIDNSLVVVTQLSQLLSYVTGCGGFLVPLVIWLTQKDKVANMDEHGKNIINFQITLWLIILLSIPGILLLGLGILGFIYAGIIGLVMPIVNAIKASNGEPPSYFSTIRFIS